MLNFCDFIQVFVFTRNHHLNNNTGKWAMEVFWFGLNRFFTTNLCETSNFYHFSTEILITNVIFDNVTDKVYR